MKFSREKWGTVDYVRRRSIAYTATYFFFSLKYKNKTFYVLAAVHVFFSNSDVQPFDTVQQRGDQVERELSDE